MKDRLSRAFGEGRFMQALEFAKQVNKAEPSASTRETLFNAYVGRGRELRGQGKVRDAVATLQNAVGLVDANATRIASLAEELAACGEVRQALTLLQQVHDSQVGGAVLTRAADAAVQQETNGRALLPEEMRGDFDRVIQAFAQLEAGQDDAARESLQAIGLRSPFLEWKLLLRGLQAYYQNDDARAIENWQRLAAERLPARLAASLRSRIDSSYRLTQPPAAQTALQHQIDRLQDQGLAPQLRTIQAALSGEGKLTQAFRSVESLLPVLRQQAPDLVARLAACFYWAIINVGYPHDMPRYLKVFGAPPDDPECHRLQALASERHHGLIEAHAHWQDYEKSVAEHPAAWPGEQAKRARALIWLHMGRNAASLPDPERIPNLPPFLRDHPALPEPLKPPADKCYQHSIKLAPDLLEAHEALFQYHRERDEPEKAEKAARQLLHHFPDHGSTLEELADLLMAGHRYPDALELFQHALRQRPLDRGLRRKIGTAHAFSARPLVEAGRFEEARAEYRAALEDGTDGSILCKWAACEFKAGNDARAEELLGEALHQSGSRLSVAYSMLIETIRLKLSPSVKRRFDREFKAVLAAPPNATDAAAALETAAAHQAVGITYHGQKTHEKKVLAYVDKARTVEFTEQQLARVCTSLLTLTAVRPLRAFTRLGAMRFPQAALFPYLEAESYFTQGPEAVPNVWQVKPLLETAHRLASEMPPDDRRAHLLESIGDRQKLVQMLDAGPFGFLPDVFDEFDDFDDDDGDEDFW